MRDSLDTPAATLDVVYLARLRDAFDRGRESLPLGSEDDVIVAHVLERLRARGGAWAVELAPGRAFRVAVNHAMASLDTPVRAGDELALFPPVTGG